MPPPNDPLSPPSYRVRYPAEDRLPWLAALLDAYAVMDAGIARAVATDGRALACRKGCADCCRQPIPASTLEIQGLRWFALERLGGPDRLGLRRSLRRSDGIVCPFLVAGVCGVYPVRPLACREYVLFGRPCRPAEQPDRTRPGDLLSLPPEVQRAAFALLLPHYGVARGADTATALRDRLVLRDTGVLQAMDWSGLADALACEIQVDRCGAEA